MTRFLPLGISLLLICAVGCSGAEKAGDAAVGPRGAARGEETLHDWSKVVSVRVTPQGQERETVGFLDRRFTLSDRDGTTFVLDRFHQERGFVLASGRTYRVVLRGSQIEDTEDLGSAGLESGIKRILGVEGAIELEAIPAR